MKNVIWQMENGNAMADCFLYEASVRYFNTPTFKCELIRAER
jgi:hypothetical protein